MQPDPINEIVERVSWSDEPLVELIGQAKQTGRRLGIFASSFDPPTVAHVELIRQAAEAFSLDEILALASHSNADKLSYGCSLQNRVAMLELALADSPRASIGLSSHAFYVDMIEALGRVYPPRTDLHFIVGFDTFERVLDPENRYTERYHREFSGRAEALDYLFAHSRFVVAARAGAGLDSVRRLIEREPAVPRDRVLYLDFPPDLGELSSTAVRNRFRSGESIKGLVPTGAEQYLIQHGLYKT
jgi:nicotinate (nicotinamide) nucleotide adenylyltransferase